MENVVQLQSPGAGHGGYVEAPSVSQYVAEAAASERTEMEARFGRVQRLAREACVTRENHLAAIRSGFDLCDDDSINAWFARTKQLCEIRIEAEQRYREACDAFFLNADERPR